MVSSNHQFARLISFSKRGLAYYSNPSIFLKLIIFFHKHYLSLSYYFSLKAPSFVNLLSENFYTFRPKM
jgi:hypothetical protein